MGIILLGLQATAQDPFFSQFFNTPLYLNPAYTGSAHQPRITAAYRNQMPALGSPYVHYCASWDQPVRVLQGGLGIHIMNDVQGGGLNRISADAMYAYFLAVNPRLTVHAGFQASYTHRVLRRSELILPDQVTAHGAMGPSQESLGDISKGYPDFAIGFTAFTRNAYAGVSMHHLTRPDLAFSNSVRQPLPRKLTVHGGMYFTLYERRLGREFLKLNPELLYMQQAGFRLAGYGLGILYKQLNTGVWIRHSLNFKVSALVLFLGYEYEGFRFGYSHDFNMLSPWRTMQHTGSHEITFSLKLEYKGGVRDRFNTIKSPKI